MQPQPLVSIIIPTYNRRRYVGDAIDSGLAQTHARCEIIVVDDGSADDTLPFLREKYGERIRLLSQANQGPGIARNRGIEAARGEFVHFLDADDQFKPEKVAMGLEVFRQRPDIGVVYTHFQFVAADGRTRLETPQFEQFAEEPFCEMLRWTGCRILLSSSMYRAKALRAVGGFEHDTRFRSAEDWDLLLRLATKFKFYGIDQRLVLRRMHADMLSDDKLRGAWGRAEDGAERAALWLGRVHERGGVQSQGSVAPPYLRALLVAGWQTRSGASATSAKPWPSTRRKRAYAACTGCSPGCCLSHPRA